MPVPGPLAIPCFVLCGANLAAGGLYLALYLKRRQTAEHLPFALLCFAIAAYDLFCAGLYSAGSLEQGVFWQRLQLLSFIPIGILLVSFVGLATEGRLNGVLRVLVGLLAALGLFALALDGPGRTVSVSTPAVKAVVWGGRTVVTYYQSRIGWLLAPGLVLFYGSVGYAMYQAHRAYRRTGSRYLLAILFGLLGYGAGLVSDTLVDFGLAHMVYLSEYAYLVLMLIMGTALLTRFDDLHLEVEKLNAGLEQSVLDGLAEIRVLSGLIPICAGCKKVRRDGGYWQQVEEYISEHTDARFSHGMCQECIERLYPEVVERMAGKAQAVAPGGDAPV